MYLCTCGEFLRVEDCPHQRAIFNDPNNKMRILAQPNRHIEPKLYDGESVS